MMGLRLIFVAALSASFAVFLVHCAPTFLTSANDDASAAAAVAAEKPLVRTKRAEEILYGNHQNAPRVKKSDPAAATSEDAVSTKNDDVTKDDTKPESSSTDGEEKIIDSEQSTTRDKQDEVSPKSEPLHNLENIPTELNDADYQRYEDQDGLEDAEALRKKRSIKTALMTAENMVDSSSSHRSSLVSRPVRAKRDLDYEDLRQLFADSREGPYEDLEDSEEPGRQIYEMAPEQGEEADDGREEEEEEEEEQEQEQEAPGLVEDVPLTVALPYEYEPRYEAPSEKEELLRELVERKVEEDAREKLLDYLLAAAIASEAESADEAETDADVDDDEGIIEAAPGRPDYEDESVQDVIGAGPRVALKRNPFYPYSYEPYGGRWGAMVPGTKRSANEYERLYRLAKALNADDDYDEQ